MIVISDTTPLISLLKINRIDLLEKLFGDVLIPQAVFEELTIDERFRLEGQKQRHSCPSATHLHRFRCGQ